MRIGLLLTDKTSGKRIGLIEFDPSGMLIMKAFQNMVHAFALNLIPGLILKEPLYMKHAKLLKEKSALPIDILEQEARFCADALNQLKKPLTVGKYTLKADSVRYSL